MDQDAAAVRRNAAMLFWAPLASGQINMRKVDDQAVNRYSGWPRR